MTKLTAFLLTVLLLAPVRAETVHSLLLKGNRLWVCTDKGVVRWNIYSLAYDVYNKKDGLSKDNITSLVIDNEGMRWFGTLGGGVCRGSNWSAMECFREIDGLVSDHISCAALGAEQRVGPKTSERRSYLRVPGSDPVDPIRSPGGEPQDRGAGLRWG